MHNFKELIVWQRSREFVKHIYTITRKFPAEEKFGLIQQICRAAVSIPSNTSEEAGRNTNKDFTHFLDIANGSAYEVETLLCLSLDIHYIEQDEFDRINNLLQDIQKLIFKFKQSLTQ